MACQIFITHSVCLADQKKRRKKRHFRPTAANKRNWIKSSRLNCIVLDIISLTRRASNGNYQKIIKFYFSRIYFMIEGHKIVGLVLGRFVIVNTTIEIANCHLILSIYKANHAICSNTQSINGFAIVALSLFPCLCFQIAHGAGCDAWNDGDDAVRCVGHEQQEEAHIAHIWANKQTSASVWRCKFHIKLFSLSSVVSSHNNDTITLWFVVMFCQRDSRDMSKWANVYIWGTYSSIRYAWPGRHRPRTCWKWKLSVTFSETKYAYYSIDVKRMASNCLIWKMRGRNLSKWNTALVNNTPNSTLSITKCRVSSPVLTAWHLF